MKIGAISSSNLYSRTNSNNNLKSDMKYRSNNVLGNDKINFTALKIPLLSEETNAIREILENRKWLYAEFNGDFVPVDFETLLFKQPLNRIIINESENVRPDFTLNLNKLITCTDLKKILFVNQDYTKAKRVYLPLTNRVELADKILYVNKSHTLSPSQVLSKINDNYEITCFSVDAPDMPYIPEKKPDGKIRTAFNNLLNDFNYI